MTAEEIVIPDTATGLDSRASIPQASIYRHLWKTYYQARLA